MTASYGTWTYAILFVVVFCETGLVVTPFLPGDSLLFAAGAICALGIAGHRRLCGCCWCVAAMVGDTVNYWIGNYLGPKVLRGERSWLFNKKHLDRTHAFYEKYGGKTIIIARFVPIVRTFAPFVAGVGAMNYRRFLVYNVVGGVAWVTGFLFAGYWFGNIPWVKENFSAVILAIIFISVMPMVVEYFRHVQTAKRQKSLADQEVRHAALETLRGWRPAFNGRTSPSRPDGRDDCRRLRFRGACRSCQPGSTGIILTFISFHCQQVQRTMLTAIFLTSVFLFTIAFFTYGRFLERRFDIDDRRATPSHTEYDGVDRVPAHPAVLFGHHFSSIAGAGPIVGPIIAAVAFGWAVPLVWILTGAIFIGGAHDFSALVASIRNRGRSIADIGASPCRRWRIGCCWSSCGWPWCTC